MRSMQRIAFSASVLACAFATRGLAQTDTFSNNPKLDHVRMQPFSLSSSSAGTSDDVLVFPVGANSSRASYDADMIAARSTRPASNNSGNHNAAGRNNQSDLSGGHHDRSSGIRGLITVPNFMGAFASGGLAAEFPFFMIGNDPARGGTTELPAKIVTFSLNLHQANGTTVNVPFAPVEQLALHSPNFEEADYSSGKRIQFGDAVQRAEFFNNMQEDWHTILHPEIVDRVTLEIPATVRVRFPDGIKTVPAYVIATARNGTRFILLLDLVFNHTVIPKVIDEINAGVYTTDAINTALLFNTSLFSLNDQGGIGDCCVGGFHTYANDDATPQSRWIFAFAGWDLPGIFRGGVADVTSLSHEISEAFNDPFVDNIVPAWQFPGLAPGTCQGNLETGDPVEVLPNSVFPVRIREDGINFVFHPQTEALLQWFEQGLSSDALGGAFSYPDTTSLPKAADACPAPPTT